MSGSSVFSGGLGGGKKRTHTSERVRVSGRVPPSSSVRLLPVPVLLPMLRQRSGAHPLLLLVVVVLLRLVRVVEVEGLRTAVIPLVVAVLMSHFSVVREVSCVDW